jgi:hypothetical protein
MKPVKKVRHIQWLESKGLPYYDDDKGTNRLSYAEVATKYMGKREGVVYVSDTDWHSLMLEEEKDEYEKHLRRAWNAFTKEMYAQLSRDSNLQWIIDAYDDHELPDAVESILGEQ